MARRARNKYWTNQCRHFTNGADVLNDKTCAKGVCYRSVTTKPDEPGSAYRLPCHAPTEERGLKILQETGPAGTCEHFDALTAEEIEQQEADFEKAMEKSMRRMTLVAPIITAMKKKYKGKSVKGVKTCPVCQGKLHLSHSGYNGHVWGKCETDGCLSWME
jgi:hypothetical protein